MSIKCKQCNGKGYHLGTARDKNEKVPCRHCVNGYVVFKPSKPKRKGYSGEDFIERFEIK